ncbi:4-hydroxy-tetrahydrodipicolinate reductase, partial [candidate division KSB1 bacterium]
SSKVYSVVLFGATGRMGREILKQAWRHDDLKFAFGYDLKNPGETVEKLMIQTQPDGLPDGIRIAMDFSSPDAVLEHLELALAAGVSYLCGVTGLPQEVVNELRAAANEIPVMHSANYSSGMNVMFKLAALAAQSLPGYERHILELHHAEKKDYPSGTALHLENVVREQVKEETPITALRMGDVTGEHRIVFGGPGERLEIVHRADARAVFAVGALRAASWLVHRSPGYYTMKDVLEL